MSSSDTIPVDSEELVVVKANSNKSGFFRNSYNHNVLTNLISMERFLKMVDDCSKIMSKSTSEKYKQAQAPISFIEKFITFSSLLTALIFLIM
jgi:hypothetical protein